MGKKRMTNPWLNISVADYEGHMEHPGVAQLQFLKKIFAKSIEKYDSRVLAYLGCATGNGLEYIDTHETNQITAIDINPDYLETLRKRYQHTIPNLEIIEANLDELELNNRSYTLIFAGLLFEYVSPRTLVAKIAKWLETTGVMVVVLQPHDLDIMKVSDTPYSSLQQLNSIMNLISEVDFKVMAKESGMMEIEGKTVTLESGKSFYVGAYGKFTWQCAD